MTATLAVGPTTLDGLGRSRLHRRVRLIVAGIIGYNVVEAVVAVWAGSLASSTALVSFGLQSVVEVLSAAAIAWQFAAPDPETRERVALRTVAVAFIGLAAYIGYDSTVTLLGRGGPDPEHTPVGIVLAAVSLLVMPVLSWLERRTGRELGSASVVADSNQTLLCTYLSAVLLGGLLANSLLGWGWADPVAALVIAATAVREGVEAWRGDSCCAGSGALLTGHAEQVDAAGPVAEADDGDGCADGCCGPPAVRVQDHAESGRR